MTQEQKKTIRCPQCRRQTAWQGNPDRPFCSERCRLIDLGAWAEEDYRIAGRPVPRDEEDKVVDFPR